MSLPIKPPFPPMDALLVKEIPSGTNWQYEPKWDGFRCIAFRDGKTVELQSKSGQSLGRYFPEVMEAVLKVKAPRFVIDGELIITVTGEPSLRKVVGSLLLGLYDEDGLLHHVGFTSSFNEAEKKELTKKLAALVKAPGFTGNKPGGPSRWSTKRTSEWEPLATKLVAEVQYDHFTGGRFRHGTRFLRWRTDKKPKQCGFDQLN